MIRCKKCGHTATRFEAVCPVCKEEHKLTGIEIEDLLSEAKTAMKKREFDYFCQTLFCKLIIFIPLLLFCQLINIGLSTIGHGCGWE